MIPRNKKTSYTSVPESLTQQLKETFSDNTSADEKTSAAAEEVKTTNEESQKASPVKAVLKKEENPLETQKKSSIEENKSLSKKQDRNGQINICIPPEIKTEWKVLFASCNVNMTQGITFAIEHLKQEIANGDVMLTIGGVIPKRK